MQVKINCKKHIGKFISSYTTWLEAHQDKIFTVEKEYSIVIQVSLNRCNCLACIEHKKFVPVEKHDKMNIIKSFCTPLRFTEKPMWKRNK